MLVETLQQSLLMLVSLTFVLGLLIGSFLNVVVYRLPRMMQKAWRRDCLEYLELPPEHDAEVFNLIWPGSRCPNCRTEIRPHQNIPLLSYLLLRGKCAHCSAHISWRYPLLEAFTAISSAMVAWHFGYGIALVFALLLTWALIALSVIDIDHQLLPDSITLPLLWLGLLLSLFSLYTDSHSAILGAIVGYLSLWSIYWLFKLLTGKEGMGYGDFKLLAVLGAWLGWQFLPLIIVLASFVGALVGIVSIVLKRQDISRPIPFGPYLAGAGWLALIYGREINQFYLGITGL